MCIVMECYNIDEYSYNTVNIEYSTVVECISCMYYDTVYERRNRVPDSEFEVL